MSDSEPIVQSEVSAALENVRCMVTLCRENCQQIMGSNSVRPIRSVGIVGAGIMGTAIASEHVKHGIPVVLMDKSPEALRQAAVMAGDELATAKRTWRHVLNQPIAYTLNITDLSGCDLVLESIVEKRAAKQTVYSQLNPHLPHSAILATNTSTIPIARLAAGQADPGRFCGLHFCHPVWLRPLVEVIPGPATAPETVVAVVAHVCMLGKLPLVVADGPGFVVNRLLMAYLNEALAMVTAGVPIERIDAAMVQFGMPLGPLEILDEIGLDTALQSGVVLQEVYTERSPGSELLVRLVKREQFGMKAGAGFYTYPGKNPNPTCGEIAGDLRMSHRSCDETSANHRALSDRLLAPMATEAARMLQEEIVTAWQIDLAMIFGLGFPLWRGGLLWWARRHEKTC